MNRKPKVVSFGRFFLSFFLTENRLFFLAFFIEENETRKPARFFSIGFISPVPYLNNAFISVWKPRYFVWIRYTRRSQQTAHSQHAVHTPQPNSSTARRSSRGNRQKQQQQQQQSHRAHGKVRRETARDKSRRVQTSVWWLLHPLNCLSHCLWPSAYNDNACSCSQEIHQSQRQWHTRSPPHI